MESLADIRPLPLPTNNTKGGTLPPSYNNITPLSSQSTSNVILPVNRLSQTTQEPLKKKVVYRYDRATMYALAPAVTQRPPDLPLMLCRDEPGNLVEIKQEMEAKLIARRLSLSKSSNKEVDSEKGIEDYDSDGDNQEYNAIISEIKSDELATAPHKILPYSVYPISNTPQALFSDFDDALGVGALRGTKLQAKNNRKQPDDNILRSPKKSQLPNGKNNVQTITRDDKQSPTIATPKPKIDQQIPRQLSVESTISPPSQLESIFSTLLPIQPPTASSAFIPANLALASINDPSNPNTSPTSLFINSVTTSHDVDVDSFFAPGNDGASFQHIFRKQFVNSNTTPPCDSLLKEDHFSSFITPAALPLADYSFSDPSYGTDLLTPHTVDGQNQVDDETGEVVLSRGFGRWFNTFDEDEPAEVVRRSPKLLPFQQPLVAIALPPNQATDVNNSIPHYLQPAQSASSASVTNHIGGNIPIDVLLRNAFQAYEERIAIPSPSTSIVDNIRASPSIITDNSIFAQQEKSVSLHNVAAESSLLVATHSTAADSMSVVDFDFTSSVDTPKTEPQLQPRGITPPPPVPAEPEVKPVSPTSNHTVSSPPILSIPLPPPANAVSMHNGRSHHNHNGRSQPPHNRSSTGKRDPYKPPSVTSKRPPSHHNAYTGTQTPHISNPRKKKDGKVTGLLAPPTQPQAFLLNFNALPTPHHPHHPHFALPHAQTFFVPQPVPHHPPIAHQHLAGHHHSPHHTSHHSHSNHHHSHHPSHTTPHTPLPTPTPGLEKWFGSALLSHPQHDPLPTMPKAARVLSVQEIENQMSANTSSPASSHSGHHNHNSNHSNNAKHNHYNHHNSGHRNSK